MSRISLNAPDNAHRPPNTGDSAEYGDSYQSLINNLNAMFADLYGGAASPSRAITAISTVGAGTLTAAAIVGEVITRSGSVAAYSDATDTAAAIIAARTNVKAGASWLMYLRNTVPFAETVTAGSGVTMAGETIVPPNSIGIFLVQATTLAAVTITGLAMVPLTTPPLLASTALSTVGAGAITAAGIAGGITNRTGSTAAFTDTTDTAANIIAALPNANIGQSFYYTYFNNTPALATLVGGVGVNSAGTIALVPAASWAEFLVTFSAAGAITFGLIAMGPNVQLPNSQLVTNSGAGAQTAAVGDITGANFCNLILTAVGAANYTTRTGAQMAADIPNLEVGFTWMFAVRNTNAGTTTVAAGATGVTINGTATIAQNVTRLFQATYTATNTFVIQSMGISAAAA